MYLTAEREREREREREKIILSLLLMNIVIPFDCIQIHRVIVNIKIHTYCTYVCMEQNIYIYIYIYIYIFV